MGKLDRLFAPRSIAVVGVSEDLNRPGSQAVQTLLRYGYKGAIYPVNPRYPQYEGLRCYPSLAAIDGEVDVVVIGIPSAGVSAVVAEGVAKKVPYTVVQSGGFKESGKEGAALQDAVVALAAQGGMRIVGPNCLGVASIHDNVYAAFGSLTRPPKLKPGPVSLVTQSGGFGVSIALTCAQAGVGFRHVIATGNEADLATPDFLDAFIDDPETRVLMVYIEGMADGRRLIDLGERALAAGKPLLVWKGGVTHAGAKAAATHTASLTGSYDYYRAAFRQAGIIEVRELHEAADIARAMIVNKLPRGRKIAVMGGSGGSAIVLADAAEQAGLELAELSAETEARLAGVVPDIGSVHNPVDFTAGYIEGRGGDKFKTAVQAVLEDPAVDAVCLNFATTGNKSTCIGAAALKELAAVTDKPIGVFLSTPHSVAADGIAALEDACIPTMPSPVRVAKTMAALADYYQARQRFLSRKETATLRASAPTTVGPISRRMSESASKAVLERIGIAVTRDLLVAGASDVPADGVRFPVAVKIASPDIAHKTEVDGVKLNVRNNEELAAAVKEVLAAARKHAPQARIDGVIVSEMVVDGHELLAGVVNDAVFGPVVVLGAGGIYAEALKDRTCRIAPFGTDTALEMVGELRCGAVLRGFRGRPAADLGALSDALARLSWFAWDNRETVAEIDINPLIVTAQGAIAADALIVGS